MQLKLSKQDNQMAKGLAITGMVIDKCLDKLKLYA